MPHILACRNWRFWVNLGSTTSLATTSSPTRSNSSSPSRPLLSGPPQFLLLLAMSRSGPPTAPLPGPGDFERFPGMGRGSSLPGAGTYGQLANVGGIPSPGGRGASADLLTPIFLAAGAANYRGGMHGAPFGDPNFNPFLGGTGAVRGQIQGFGEMGAQGLPAPPPPPVAWQPILRTPRRRRPLRPKSTPLRASATRPRRLYAEKETGPWVVILLPQPFRCWR